MKIIALDVGNKRIGVAISDELGMFAHPLYTVKRKGIVKDYEEILLLLEKHSVDKVVIGLPKNMDGSVGFQADKTIAFAEGLKERTNVEVVFWDERLSTKTARDIMLSNNIKQTDRKEIIDTIAATVILDNYLGSMRK